MSAEFTTKGLETQVVRHTAMRTVGGNVRSHPPSGRTRHTAVCQLCIGTFLGIVLLVALVMAIVFAPRDLYRQGDIGIGKKLLWVAAFVLSAGVVLVIYGAVRYSRTDGNPGW